MTSMANLNECYNCHEPFEDPRLLPCLHTFCMRCIQEMAKEDPFTCVCCRQPALPGMDIALLPVNFVAGPTNSAVPSVNISSSASSSSSNFSSNSVLMSSSKSNSTSTSPTLPECSECADGTLATDRCNNCNTKLCDDHARVHRRKKRHDTERLFGTASSEMCNTHHDEILRAFCDICGQLVCTLCMMDKHNGHKFSQLSDAAKQQSQALSKGSSELAELERRLSVAIDNLGAVHAAVLASKISITNEITNKFNSLIHDLETRRDLLIAQAQADLEIDDKTLLLQRDELDMLRSRASAARTQALAMTTRGLGQPHELLLLSRIVVLRLKELREKEPLLDPLVDGALKFKFSYDDFGSELGSLSRRSGRVQRDYQNISKPTVVLGTFGNSAVACMRPVGVAETRSGLLFISDDRNNRLQLMTSRGGFVRAIGSPGHEPGQFEQPQYVSVSQQGLLWVCDWGNNKMQSFSERGELVREFTCPRPIGVCFLSNGDLAIAHVNGIRVCSVDGAVRWSLGGPGVAPGRFNRAFGIAVTSEDYLVVADSGNNRLQILSGEDGRVINVIDEHIDSPFAVCVGPDDILFVTERNPTTNTARVSVWTLKGERLHEWGSEGDEPGQFVGINGICCLSDGRIAVTDNARIQLF